MASTALSVALVHADGPKSEPKSSDFLRDLPSSSDFLKSRQSSSSSSSSSLPSFNPKYGYSRDGIKDDRTLLPNLSAMVVFDRKSNEENGGCLTVAKEEKYLPSTNVKLLHSNCSDDKPLLLNGKVISFLSGEDKNLKLQNTQGSEKNNLLSGSLESLQKNEILIEEKKTTKAFKLSETKHTDINQPESQNQQIIKPQNHRSSIASSYENLQIVVHSSSQQNQIDGISTDVHKIGSRLTARDSLNRGHGSRKVMQRQMVSSANSLRGKSPLDDARKDIMRTPRVLPSVGAFAIQCASCMKWRLAPSKEHYERIRQSILESPFYCSSGQTWNPMASCDDPPELSDDSKYLWAIDKPNIPLAPEGWQRLLVIRGAGASKFADIYYVAPNGKKLRSMPDVERYLAENPWYVVHGGVSLNQFSFVIPRSLDKNYCRKRANTGSNANASNHMRGSIINSQPKKLLKNSLGQRCEPLKYGENVAVIENATRSSVSPINGDVDERFSIVPYTPQPFWSSASSGIKYLC